MPLEFYKASPKVTGSGCSFNFNSKDGNLFVNLIKQVSWNNGVGGFKGGKNLAIKFSMPEMAGIINCLEKNETFSAFHQTDSSTSQITFAPYIVGETQKGYGLKVFSTKGDVKEGFLVPFNFNDGLLIRQYLKFVLEHCFSAIYSSDKKKNEDYLKKKNLEKDANVEIVKDEPVISLEKEKVINKKMEEGIESEIWDSSLSNKTSKVNKNTDDDWI